MLDTWRTGGNRSTLGGVVGVDMEMKVIRRATVVLATLATLLFAVTVLAATAVAKGGMYQITVSGPGFEHPIEIDDPLVLDEFNPWGGLHRFLGERMGENAVETRGLGDGYRVSFFMSVHDWVYEFSYYPDRDAGVGYVLLPQPPESQGFVHPAGWYRSSDAWNEVMFEQLQGVQNPTRSGDRLVGNLLMSLGAIALITGVGVAVHGHPDDNLYWRLKGM